MPRLLLIQSVQNLIRPQNVQNKTQTNNQFVSGIVQQVFADGSIDVIINGDIKRCGASTDMPIFAGQTAHVAQIDGGSNKFSVIGAL